MSNPDPNGPDLITVPNVAPAGALHVNGLITDIPRVWSLPSSSALYNTRFTDDGSGIVPLNTGDMYDGTYISGGTDASIVQETLGTATGGISGSEVEGQNLFLAAKYDLSDSFEVFGQVLYGKTESNSQTLHSGATMSGSWAPTVFRDNPYLPQAVIDAIDNEGLVVDRGDGVMVPGIKLNKGGSYLGVLDVDSRGLSKNVFETTSWTVGFNAEFDNGWNLDFRWQTGESDKETAEYDSLRVDRLALAMDAVVDPNTGAIVCNVQLHNPTPEQLAAAVPDGYTNSRDGSPLASPIGLDNSIRDCVPFNIMGNGQISPAAADYIMTPKIGKSTVEQDFAELVLNGELFEGFGAGPVSFATGVTYREQSFTDGAFPADVDALGPPINAPELGIRGIAAAWQGGSPNLHQFSTVSLLSGEYDVTEVFGELNLPIFETSAGQHLGISLAARSSDYSSSGRAESWKAGLDFQVVEDLRFRATRSRDVREPNFTERTDVAPGGGPPVRDRWNQIPGGPFSTGLFATITYTTVGNPDLEPEFADTTVLGFVYEPSWLSGLRMSIDWYDIEIEGSIDALAAQRVIDGCYGYDVPQNTELCQYIVRNNGAAADDPSEPIVRVFQPYLNFDAAEAEGIDFEVSYTTDVNLFADQSESFSIRLLGGKLLGRSDLPRNGEPAEFEGTRGYPELTGNLSATYNLGPWSIQWQERYVDEVRLNRLWEEGVDVDNNKINSRSWSNLRFGFDGQTQGGGDWRLSLNIQNLFDEFPPIIASSNARFNSQSVDNTYDVWGRRYQLSLNMTF